MPVRDTTDIALAAYMSMRAKRDKTLGLRLQKVERNGVGSMFVFKDEKDLWDEIVAEFPHSESCEFDLQVRALKAIGYSRDRSSRNARH